MARQTNTHDVEDSRGFAKHARRAAASHRDAAMRQVKEAARTGDVDTMAAAIDDLMLATYYLGAADTHDQYAGGAPTRVANPERRRGMAALGGFFGSLVGIVGSLTVLGGPMTLGRALTNLVAMVGSVVGGALGAKALAATDRKRGAARGGAIGGVLGPLGAAAGGALGSTDPDRRRNSSKNISRRDEAIVVGTGVGASVESVHRDRRKRRRMLKNSLMR